MLNPETRVCSRSGFQLIRYEQLTGYQVSKPAYGGCSGPPRSIGAHASTWNRWDIPGQTYYYADRPFLAFVEVLAHVRQNLTDSTRDAKYAEFLGMDENELAYELRKDRDETNRVHSERRAMEEWRAKHEVFQMELPVDGWWIDTGSARTLKTLDRFLRMRPTLRTRFKIHGRALDRSDLMNGDRSLTTILAAFMRHKILSGGDPQALGLTFESRRDHGTCVAFWGRPGSQPRLIRSWSIDREDQDYVAACDVLGLPAS